jgi:membrane protein YdbS with pleckstrin-like domain
MTPFNPIQPQFKLVNALIMHCQNCGNSLTPESQYCNRCGAKVQRKSLPEPRRAAHLAVPPPRPARRAPTVPAASDPEPLDDYEEDSSEGYDSDRYDSGPRQSGRYQPGRHPSGHSAPGRFAEDYYEEDGDEEQIIFRISPAFYEVSFTYLWATALSLIVTAAVAYARGPLWIAGAFAMVFFVAPVVRHIRLKSTVFTLTTVKIEIRKGIFSTSTRNIPLRSIQDVTVSETLKERMIGIGDVLIDSAAMEGKIAMNNIKNPRIYADLILDQLQYWN